MNARDTSIAVLLGGVGEVFFQKKNVYIYIIYGLFCSFNRFQCFLLVYIKPENIISKNRTPSKYEETPKVSRHDTPHSKFTLAT